MATRFILSVAIWGSLTGCMQNQSENPPWVSECSRAFVIEMLLGAYLMEYDDSGVRVVREIPAPSGSALSQAAYHCPTRSIVATFSSFEPDPVKGYLKNFLGLGRRIQAGLAIIKEDGSTELIELPYTPHTFEADGEDLLITTRRIHVRDNGTPKNGQQATQDDLSAGDQGQFFTKVLRFNLTEKRTRSEYVDAGPADEIYLQNDWLYMYSDALRLHTKSGQVERFLWLDGFVRAPVEFAVTRSGRVFMLIGRPYEPNETAGLCANCLYEIIDTKPRLVLEVPSTSTRFAISYEDSVFVISDDRNSGIIRYDTISGQHVIYPLKHEYVVNAAKTSDRILLMTNRWGDDRVTKGPAESAHTLHIATPDFSSVITAQLPNGHAMGIATNAQYSGGRF